MTLVSVTAYHSFSGEVEASNTPTIRRLTPSCRHQLPRIALRHLREQFEPSGARRRGTHSFNICKRITCAAPAGGVLHQNVSCEKIIDIARSRILRAFGKRCPFGRSQFPLKSVQHAVKYRMLPLVEGLTGMYFPKFGLEEHRSQYRFGAIERAAETSKKPFQPRGDVEIALLRRFQNIVVGVALLPNLRGHAVETLRAFFRMRELLIGNGTRNAAIPVFERVDGDEPQMRNAGLEHRIGAI